jgi:hypothetical protein
MTAQYTLVGSSYRSYPSENMLHTQLWISVSSPSTTDNEGGGWLATGPIGSASGSAFSSFVEADVVQTRAVNRGLVAKDYLFYLSGDRLWRMDYSSPQDVGGYDGFVPNYWSTVHTFTSMEAGRTGRNTGIYSCLLPINTSGTVTYKRCIIGLYNSTVAGANTWKGFRHLVDEGTTSETSATDLSFNAPGNQGAVKAEILFNNILYFIGTTDGGVGSFDPVSMTLTRNTWPTTDIWGPHDFCPYKGKLYCLNRGERGGGGGSGIYIWEVIRGQTPRLAINFAQSGIGVSSNASEPFEARSVLFTDRHYLYAGIVSQVDSSTDAYHFHRLLGDDNGTFLYDGRVPHVLNAGNTRVNFFTEQNTYPDIAGDGPLYSASSGQMITIKWDSAGATGSLRQSLAWNGHNSALTQEESLSGWGLHHLRETARPHCKAGGGERIWTPTSIAGWSGPRADIKSITYGTTQGRVTLQYEIYNNPVDFPAGSPCWIQLRWDTKAEMPFARATLANPNVGTLKDNNTVVYIPASASGTVYTVEWDYWNSGITARQNFNVSLMVSTTGTP